MSKSALKTQKGTQLSQRKTLKWLTFELHLGNEARFYQKWKREGTLQAEGSARRRRVPREQRAWKGTEAPGPALQAAAPGSRAPPAPPLNRTVGKASGTVPQRKACTAFVTTASGSPGVFRNARHVGVAKVRRLTLGQEEMNGIDWRRAFWS